MRLPRVRVTIGRLMIVVLVAGLVFWAEILPRLTSPIAEQLALANYQQAKLTREVAEYALLEYREGTASQDLAAIDGDIALATTDMERAAARFQWQQRQHNPLRSDEMAELDPGKREQQRQTLQKLTRDKQIKSLQSDIERARADEKVKQQTYGIERTRRRGFLGF